MKLTINQVVKLAITLLVLPLMAVVLWNPATSPAHAAAITPDAAADVYAAKCKMCHGDKAQKFFDATACTDDQLVEIILKGKKGEKPPFMPAFEPKGVNAEQAKALVDYMKLLKQ
jgi:mono/diheme cytochrome c family protein